ncbi:MAG: Verru_Chthon cassette protein A, partial [Prosthecobacter sp.]|nr:Verru_Chthon cassette protein A [Prosthecobacter sp.]
EYRTVFDRTIAYCSRLAGRDYYFTRRDSASQNELSTIVRNRQLHNYLLDLTSRPIPGFATTKNATFDYKYGDNLQQILVEIFDYIRCTNLYDENIAEQAVGDTPTIPSIASSRLTSQSSTGGMQSKTFTPMRNADGASYAGHGQVMPTVLPKGKDEVYRGMGRFLTISEVGLHFIATAQGTNIAGGVSSPKIVPTTPPAEVGYTPPNWKSGVWGTSENWYSNFPPLTGQNQDPSKGFYKTKYPSQHELEGHDGDNADHPGYNPVNWNWTLDKDTPLEDGKKRIQATFLLEWFCPSTGWTLINPDIQIEVDASQLSAEGVKMFPVNNGNTIVRPFQHMSNAWGIYQRGGTISYRAFLQGRKLPSVFTGLNGFQHGSLLEDQNYKQYASRTDLLKECNQYNLVSDFMDVDADGKINFSGGTVIVKIRSNAKSPRVLQTFNFKFPPASFPAPNLITKNEDTTWSKNFNGTYAVKHPVPAPYWWALNADGALGRDKNGNITTQAKTDMGGRFRFIGNEIGTYGDNPGEGRYYRGNLVTPDDTLQSLVLRHGDPRLTMGQFTVPDTEFVKHRFYGQQRLAHNIVLAHWSDGPGLDRGEDKKGWRLVKDANYYKSFLPDHAYAAATGAGLQKYGDFDRGIANQTDGAYINKPDEGNTYGIISASTGEQSVPYFTDPWKAWLGGSTYFSPNRQVASPGMFGSLPTGVHNAGNTPFGKRREAWRTLLFRPQTWSTKRGQRFHIGAPNKLKGYGKGTAGLPVQGIDPPDYLFMDFFWMPVVEPYAISAPGSTAGKINMNYQMAPFRHIHRATAMHAVMKSELITAVSHADANIYLRRPGSAPPNGAQTWFWKDDSSASGRKFWHRQIDLEATMKLFDERFESGFSFISPAQICEMYLLPKKADATDTLVPTQWPDKMTDLIKTGNQSGILKFWEDHAITGENLKERPYTNIYPRLTTRSNTYQVFMRAQVIRKARSSDASKFEADKDQIGAEYRGSAVIERYLDLHDDQLDPSSGLDYATGDITSKPTLDDLHRFRVIAQKRFDP